MLALGSGHFHAGFYLKKLLQLYRMFEYHKLRIKPSSSIPSRYRATDSEMPTSREISAMILQPSMEHSAQWNTKPSLWCQLSRILWSAVQVMGFSETYRCRSDTFWIAMLSFNSIVYIGLRCMVATQSTECSVITVCRHSESFTLASAPHADYPPDGSGPPWISGYRQLRDMNFAGFGRSQITTGRSIRRFWLKFARRRKRMFR